ncbi:WD repeat-containing protein WRAP73 isoform X2 [Apis mellifera]|uniref:WD repeat-containing protein WRAP73 isoform X2 n=1 Tax=Apis mellifera TaxID=7460 RepID=A0A7M7MQ09_APIME|nr:WD repeat-containing protein WRAP73 isoform X2 [Apis mellifera]|eukprot:XP_026299062.1 WD repeat-containing protein WRAP73 isoform X2 [Apis mellifera]
MSLEVENDIIRINNQLCDFSKDDIIEYLEWSRNSEYILCANIKKAIIQVYSIHYPEWKYKLIEGSAGLESVNWSPDSKYILTLSDFNIQISIWSLENQSVIHIQNVKSFFHKLYFSPNGDKLAVVVSIESKDNIEIYKTDIWKLNKKLICGHLNSIDGICWSPNSELLCIWSSFSDETKLIIYSTIFERDIAVFYPAQFQNLKGIENVTWMPSGQLLAVTGFNEMIVLLNHVTWKPLLHLYLEPIIKENYLNKVYEERIIQLNFSNKSTNYYNKYILEEKSERPINIKIGRKNNIERLSIAKFDILEFSSCGQYLAIKHQLYPTTLWIWNIIDDYLDYLLLENAIVAAKWNPTRAHLLIFCECVRIFEWTPHNANCISSPRNITILDARWHPQGNFLLLCGYNKAIIYQIENK